MLCESCPTPPDGVQSSAPNNESESLCQNQITLAVLPVESSRALSICLFFWPETLVYSHRLLCTLVDLERVHVFFMSVDESFLSFVVTLDGLSTTFVIVWPELMIVDESWRKLSWESTFINCHPRLARALHLSLKETSVNYVRSTCEARWKKGA